MKALDIKQAVIKGVDKMADIGDRIIFSSSPSKESKKEDDQEGDKEKQ
jgi:hypothetical protein